MTDSSSAPARSGRRAATILASALIAAASAAVAQPGPVPTPKLPPKGPPSFFVTSVGSGHGGDLGGLAGADQHCQALATAAGLGSRHWHAYLSTQAEKGVPAINARDRIGAGPWFNVQGVRIATNLQDLHGDTLETARAGNLIAHSTSLTEKGEVIPGDAQHPSYHDMLTGSQIDGRAYTDAADHSCHNWTSGSPDATAQVGHSDRDSKWTNLSWNSSHPSPGCSSDRLLMSGGKGLFYCFAADIAPGGKAP